jgi:hypothetical protein
MASFYMMAVLMFGCATTPSLPVQSINPIKTSGATYVIGKTETASTGSAMLTIYDKYVVPTYIPRYSFQPPNAGIWSSGPITPEQTWIVKYSVENNYLIFSSSHRSDKRLSSSCLKILDGVNDAKFVYGTANEREYWTAPQKNIQADG